MFDNYQTYFNQAISKKSNIELLMMQQEQLKQEKINLENDMKQTIHKEKVYDVANDVMKKVVDGMSRSQIDQLEKLINTSLETIFFDKQYSIEFTVTELRNTNNLQMALVEVLDNGELIKTKLDANGYGIKAIIGFILQVYYILYHKLKPILFMDEAFTTLSNQYVPYLKSLLNELITKYNFIFVLITHDPRFMDLADRTYLVNKGVVTLHNG